MNIETVRGWGIGWVLALLVLIACFVLWLIGKPLDNGTVLALVAMLALSRLL